MTQLAVRVLKRVGKRRSYVRTSRERRIWWPSNVSPPLPNVILVGHHPDVFVWRGALQLVHLFPQSFGASQRHASAGTSRPERSTTERLEAGWVAQASAPLLYRTGDRQRIHCCSYGIKWCESGHVEMVGELRTGYTSYSRHKQQWQMADEQQWKAQETHYLVNRWYLLACSDVQQPSSQHTWRFCG